MQTYAYAFTVIYERKTQRIYVRYIEIECDSVFCFVNMTYESAELQLTSNAL